MNIETLHGKVTSVNLRTETHGGGDDDENANHVLAIDVGITIEACNLDAASTLTGGGLETVTLAHLQESGIVPDLGPLSLEHANHRVTLHPAKGDDLFAGGPLEIAHAKINKITIGLAEHEKSMADAKLRIQFYPTSENQAGRLGLLLKEHVRLEIEPDVDEEPNAEQSNEGAGNG